MTDWELFTGGGLVGRKKKRGAKATIYKSRKLALTESARAMIASKYVNLAYNKQRRAIGLIPASRDDDDAYVVHKAKTGQMSLINLSGFIRYHDLDLDIVGKTFDVVERDGMAVIFLNGRKVRP